LHGVNPLRTIITAKVKSFIWKVAFSSERAAHFFYTILQLDQSEIDQSSVAIAFLPW